MKKLQKKSETKNKLIVIVGPTASGKSDLAVKIAKKYGGEIISADSRQVYRGMDIGTEKVPRDRPNKKRIKPNAKRIFAKNSLLFDNNSGEYLYRGIPHYLLDVASPRQIFTAAKYQKLARKKINEIWKRGKMPILCGGTGFYIQSIVDGLAIPEVKPNYKLRRKLENKTTEELFQMLKKKDPRRANSIDSKNPRRLIRAIEIIEALGKVPSIKKSPLECDALFLGIKKEKTNLKNLISTRLNHRLKAGMLKEIKKLHHGGVSWKRMEELGLEYRYGARYLQNKISYQEFIDALTKEIYAYAKRQMTWFKRDERIKWIKKEKEAFAFAKKFFKKNHSPIRANWRMVQ